MIGQMSIYDYLGYPDYYDECGQKQKSWIREGFKNAYHEMPDHDILAEVIDRADHRFKTKIYRNKFGYMVFNVTKAKGYDIIWWKEIEPDKSCHTCSYYRMTCDAYTCEPTGIKTCSKFEAWSQNKNLDPENGCELWEDTK